jgi:hypothetical protein
LYRRLICLTYEYFSFEGEGITYPFDMSNL